MPLGKNRGGDFFGFLGCWKSTKIAGTKMAEIQKLAQLLTVDQLAEILFRFIYLKSKSMNSKQHLP